MATPNFLDRIRGFFGIGINKDKGIRGEIVPAERKSGSDRSEPIPMDSYAKHMWNWWLNEVHDTTESLKNRLDRYTDLEYMRINDGLISNAARMYADEATQSDSQSKVIGIAAKKSEVEKEIQRLLNVWGLTTTVINSCCDDIAYYGDSFLIHSVDEKEGITEMTKVDPRAIKDRVEFNAAEAQLLFQKTMGMMNITSVGSRMQKISKAVNELGTSYQKFFKSFLFGYQLDNDEFLPPWCVTHFRLFTSNKDVKPWGLSLFYYTISLFRQYKAAKNLIALGRALSLPKEKFEVNTGESMTAAEKFEAVEEARDEWNQSMQFTRMKDDPSLGSQYWLPKETIEHTMIENNYDVSQIHDIELYRDEEIASLRIPKGVLMQDSGGWGQSGQSLLQQSKIFGRAVFTVQSAFLQGITEAIRLHFMITGQFDKENTEFELTMNFPVLEEARDRMSAKGDSLRLAKDAIDIMKELLGIEEPLPKDIVRSILSKLTFLTSDELDDWLEKSYKQMQKSEIAERFMCTEDEIDNFLKESEKRVRKQFQERLYEGTTRNSSLFEDQCKTAMFESKKRNGMKEGVLNRMHYYSSINSTTEDRIQMEYARLFFKTEEDPELKKPRKK